MSQQIIDIGAEANDGTGEPLRSAFSAVNNNFTQIFSAGPVGSDVKIAGNTITVTGINNNLVLAANGIGNIQTNSSIVPGISGVYSLGDSTAQFDSVYAVAFYGNGAGLTGVSVEAGNVILNGNSNVRIGGQGANVTVSVNSVSNVAVFSTAGLSVPSNINVGNLNAVNLTVSGPITTNLVSQANITANYFLGNGSLLSGMYSNTNVQNFLPTYTGSLDSLQGSIVTTGNITGGNIRSTGALSVTGGLIAGNVTALGTLTAVGNIRSNQFFVGNGRFLEGVISAPANLYGIVNANGTSLVANSTATALTLTPGNNIIITGNDLTLAARFDVSQNPVFQGNVSAAGNITSNAAIQAAGNVTAGNVISQGTISAAGNVAAANLLVAANINTTNLTATAVVSAAGNLTAANISTAGAVVATGNITGSNFFGAGIFRNGTSVELGSTGNVIVTPLGTSPDRNWTFTGSGNVNFGQGFGKIINNGSFGVSLWSTDFADTSLEWSADGVARTSNVRVNSNVTISTASGAATWRFDPTGNLNLPNGMKIESVSGNAQAVYIGSTNTRIQIDREGKIALSSSDGTGNTYVWDLANNGNTVLPHNNVSNVTSVRNRNNSGNIDFELGADKNIVLRANLYNSLSPAWTFNTSGALDVPLFGTLGQYGRVRGVGLQLRGGTDNSGSNTSLVLSSDADAATNPVTLSNDVGNIVLSANENSWIFGANSDLTAPGNISANFFVGNGSQLTGLPATYSNADVALYLASGTNSSNIVSTANISANFFVGNGSQLSGMYSNTNVQNFLPTYTGNLTSLAGPIFTTGNISGSNLITTGQITAAGNIIGGNLITAGNISTAGNITGSFLFGNGSLLTGVVSSYTNADVAAYLPTYTGNLSSLQGNVVTTANISGGNISTVGRITANSVTVDGNVSAGNLVATNALLGNSLITTNDAIIGGNLIVNGDTTYVNVTDMNVQDPVIGLGRGPNNSPLVSNDGKDRGEQLWYYTDAERSAFVGYDNSEGKMIVAANVTITNDQVTVVNYGNTVVGNLEAATVTGTNITSTTVSALGNIIGGNISSAGALSATGNITGGNVTTSGTISTSGNIVGSNVLTTNLSLAGNIIGALNVTGNITGGNVTSVGSLTAAFISSSGNIVTGSGSGGNILGANVISATTFTATGNVNTGNVNTGYISATGNIDSAKINTTDVYADFLSVTGNIIGGNVRTGIVSATGNIIGGNVQTTLVAASAVNATGNVTGGNIATAGRITAAGNVIGGNLTTTGTIDGSNLLISNTVTATGNIVGGNIVTANSVTALNVFASSNISAVGNVTGGNLATAGLITAAGNITGGNIATAGVITSASVITGANLIATAQISAAGNITAVGNVIGTNFVGNVIGNITTPGANTQLIFNQNGVLGARSGLVFDYVGNALTVGGDIATQNGGNLQVAGAVSVTGNITVGIGNINGSNIRGTVISASGNVLGGNISTTGTVTATGNIVGGNLSGTSIVGTLTTAAQTNITAVGTLGVLTVTGNVLAGNLITNGTISTTNGITATGNVAGGNVVTGGQVSAVGNVAGGNINTAGQVVATGNITGSNVIASNLTATRIVFAGTGGVLVGADGFVYSSGNSTLLAPNFATGAISVVGNITSGNVFTGGEISATGNVTGTNLAGTTLSLSGNVISAINMVNDITTTGNIIADNIAVTSSINIAGDQVATVDDATALAIALG